MNSTRRLVLLLASLGTVVSAPLAAANTASTRPAQEDKKAEYERRLAEAEGSVEKLWKVYDWCEARGMDKEGRAVARKILKLDDSQRRAHEVLGEIEYDGKWFASEKKVEEYKKKQLEDEAKRTGKVLHKGELVDPADLPFLEKGMKRLESGEWVSAEDYKRVTEGWVKQDLVWVSPEEKPNLEKGLWKCGDKWLSEADADKYHSEVGKWWAVPSDHFVVYTTCTRKTVDKILDECRRAHREFNRVAGRTPLVPVPILVLNSSEQYNAFLGGSNGNAELRGFSSLHGATIAETWEEPLRQGMTSAGVTYWNVSNDADNKRGPIWVRHAAAQALAEGLDPSPKSLSRLVAGTATNAIAEEWWKEKMFPQWFRYGGVSYVERWIPDQFVAAGGDADWIRKWSKENLVRVGGLDSLESILACSLSLESIDASVKLLNETGLLVHFILDGKCMPIVEAHGALKQALKNPKDPKAIKNAFTVLEGQLRKHEAEFRKFAGL